MSAKCVHTSRPAAAAAAAAAAAPCSRCHCLWMFSAPQQQLAQHTLSTCNHIADLLHSYYCRFQAVDPQKRSSGTGRHIGQHVGPRQGQGLVL